MASKQRIDQLLVARGLFESRARAQAAIAAGLVRVDGATARKASEAVNADAQIDAEQPHPWVSRGGLKLTHALDVFGVDPNGRFCLDVGSSTGGFTDVLLTRGARRVIAVDTGRDQFHARLRSDPRVALHESCDIRRFTPAPDDERASLIVVDVSFISLSLILPALAPLATADAILIALIKPQFEVGRANIGKNGVVADASARQDAIARIQAKAAAEGWRVDDVIDSPIEGGDGNREYLMLARRSGS